MNPEAWRPVIARYPSSCQPIGVVEALGNAGGFSGSRLWRFDSARGRLLLRAWPGDGPDPVRLGRIHGWIGRAGTLAFVPTPIAATDGTTFQDVADRLWDLSSWMPGVADLARPPSSARVRAAFAGLAVIHERFPPKRRAPSPGIEVRSLDLGRWTGGDFAALRSCLLPGGADVRSDLARIWLDRASQHAAGLRDLVASGGQPIPIQPCLRDARADHFLFEGDRLAGLVDYGAMGVDTVAGDLARLLGEMLPADRSNRFEALEAYRSVRPIADEEARLIPIFEAANAVLGAGRWVRWHFLEGRTFDDPDAVVDGIRRGLQRMDEFGPIPRTIRT